MINEEIEKLKKRIEDLEWERSNAHAFIFNITPNREPEDMVEDLCEQIAILEERMHPHCIVCNCDRRKPLGSPTCICGVAPRSLISKMNEEADRLAKFLVDKFGVPDREESVVDMAIRLLDEYKLALTKVSIMKERGC